MPKCQPAVHSDWIVGHVAFPCRSWQPRYDLKSAKSPAALIQNRFRPREEPCRKRVGLTHRREVFTLQIRCARASHCSGSSHATGEPPRLVNMARNRSTRNPLYNPAQVGHDESEAGTVSPGSRSSSATTRPGCVPASGPKAESDVIPAHVLGRPAERALH